MIQPFVNGVGFVYNAGGREPKLCNPHHRPRTPESRDINHRQLGANTILFAMWFDTADAAPATIGKTRDLHRFRALVDLTGSRCPELTPLLGKRPLDALAEDEVWPRLLDVVEWLRLHPRPGIYLRQVDVAGVHTKLIEQHQRMLGAMLDLVMPESAINPTANTPTSCVAAASAAVPGSFASARSIPRCA